MLQPVAKVVETLYTVFWHKWPVHDLVLVIPPPPLIKVASNTRPYSKLGGTTLNGREEGGQPWGHCNTQEKLKTKIMKSFGRQIRCIMGDIRIANAQFWNWLVQGRIYGIQSLVCSWHHNSLVIILWEKNSSVLTPNMGALPCGCKPRIHSLVTWVEQEEMAVFAS